MRNKRSQRNFRGQSGRPTTYGTSRATINIQCHCQYTYLDDMTGSTMHGEWICTGTATQGVVNCSCCRRIRGKAGQNAPNALAAG